MHNSAIRRTNHKTNIQKSPKKITYLRTVKINQNPSQFRFSIN